jgi:hypothetical protein
VRSIPGHWRLLVSTHDFSNCREKNMAHQRWQPLQNLSTPPVGESTTSRLRFWPSRRWVLLSANVVPTVSVTVNLMRQLIWYRSHRKIQPAFEQACEYYGIRFAETVRELWIRFDWAVVVWCDAHPELLHPQSWRLKSIHIQSKQYGYLSERPAEVGNGFQQQSESNLMIAPCSTFASIEWSW